MKFVNEDLLVKIKTLPLDKRQKVMDGLVKMLAERPKGLFKEVQNPVLPVGVQSI